MTPLHVEAAERVEVPPADEDWHPIARRLYESLAESGASALYEPSDWAVAFLVAESMSRELSPQPIVKDGTVTMVTVAPRAAAITAWLKAFNGLMVTEGDRQRARLVLERPEAGEEPSEATLLEDYRARLQGPS